MILKADATKLPLADKSVDFVFGSPPYCDARTYGIGADRGCVEWVEWMLDVTAEAQRVCRGPVVWVAAGVTRKRNYWPACEGLMWEWWKRGGDCQLYRPVFWHRVGIPGSGGDDWFRADVEYCMCFKRNGKLPWAENTAMGKPPVFGPGGDPSNRKSDGTRVGDANRDAWGFGGRRVRTRSGTKAFHLGGNEVETAGAPMADNGERIRKRVNRVQRNGDGERAIRGDEVQMYRPPPLANPGNLIRTKVGGGAMGNKIAHESEAPFPLKLAEWWIRSMCPPGGKVLDPFCGSGTVAECAKMLGRKYIASDIRESQCELTRRRVAEVQLVLA